MNCNQMKARIRDLKAKWGLDLGLQVCVRCVMPKITIGLQD